jgi:hypothetical protein
MSETAQSPTSKPLAGPGPSSGGWYDAIVGANEAWLCACTGVASAMAAAAETQARLAGEMIKLWFQDGASTAFARGPDMAEEGLLLAEAEGERLAEAARRSLFRLGGSCNIVPLPE